MTTRDSAPWGAPCWIELSSSDPERAKDFYAQVFGWTSEDAGEEFGNYVNFSKGDAVVAGMMRNDPEQGRPDGWLTYLASEDAKATVDAAAKAGGQVILEPMQVADLGTMACVLDVGGAGVGVWQPGAHKGFGVIDEAGTPAWHELHTRDFAATVSFYERVFGWTTKVVSDTDEFRYTQLVGPDGTDLAGVMDAKNWAPEQVTASWQVYLGATDVDATLAKVVELRGSVLQAAEDTPFGRLAMAGDPTGATFKLVSVKA
jgi:uncharacterized protein